MSHNITSKWVKKKKNGSLKYHLPQGAGGYRNTC